MIDLKTSALLLAGCSLYLKGLQGNDLTALGYTFLSYLLVPAAVISICCSLAEKAKNSSVD